MPLLVFLRGGLACKSLGTLEADLVLRIVRDLLLVSPPSAVILVRSGRPWVLAIWPSVGSLVSKIFSLTPHVLRKASISFRSSGDMSGLSMSMTFGKSIERDLQRGFFFCGKLEIYDYTNLVTSSNPTFDTNVEPEDALASRISLQIVRYK